METVVEQIDAFEKKILEDRIRMAEVNANYEQVNEIITKEVKKLNADFVSMHKSFLRRTEMLCKLAVNVKQLQHITGIK